MKKLFVVMVLAIVALAVSVSGMAFAQTPQPLPLGTRSPMLGGTTGSTVEGPLHDYMINAMAAALGISPSDLEARLAAGKTAYQIALDLGISADKIPALLANARAKAFDAAVAAGVIAQQKATRMNSRGAGLENCSGGGLRRGDGMSHGWRWQQTSP